MVARSAGPARSGTIYVVGNVNVDLILGVLDTIGAGDVFNACYLHGVMCGRDLGSALQQAVATASAAISTPPRRYRA